MILGEKCHTVFNLANTIKVKEWEKRAVVFARAQALNSEKEVSKCAILDFCKIGICPSKKETQ